MTKNKRKKQGFFQRLFLNRIFKRMRKLLGKSENKQDKEMKKYVESELDKISKVHNLSKKAEEERIQALSEKVEKHVQKEKAGKARVPLKPILESRIKNEKTKETEKSMKETGLKTKTTKLKTATKTKKAKSRKKKISAKPKRKEKKITSKKKTVKKASVSKKKKKKPAKKDTEITAKQKDVKEIKEELRKLRKSQPKDSGSKQKIKKLEEKLKNLKLNSVEKERYQKMQKKLLQGFEKVVKQQKIPSIQIILNQLQNAETPDEKIKHYKELLKRAKYEYYKMNLSPDQYKRMVLEYDHGIREQLIEKKVKKKESKKKGKNKTQKITVKVTKSKQKTSRSPPFQIDVGKAVEAQQQPVPEPKQAREIPEPPAKEQEPVPRKREEREKSEFSKEDPKPEKPVKIQKPFKQVKQEIQKQKIMPAAAEKPAETKKTRENGKINEIKELFKDDEEEKRSEPGAATISAERRDQKIQAMVREHSPEMTQDQSREIENKIQEAMKKYEVSHKEISQHLSHVESNNLVQDFDKLIGMIEKDRGINRGSVVRHEVIPDMPKGFEAKKEEKAVSKEIKEFQVETDYDRIMNIVQEKGSASGKEIAKLLNITPAEVKERSQVLEDSGLIKLEYPAIGGIRIVDPEKEKKDKELKEKEKKDKEETALKAKQKKEKKGEKENDAKA